MNIMKKELSGLLLFFFLFIPLLVGKLSIWLKITDLKFIAGWKNFYEAAWGGADGYCLTVVSSLILSPLVLIWVCINSNIQKISHKPKAFALGLCGLVIFIILSTVTVLGPPLSSIENPSKGVRVILLLGRSHVLFSLGYGVMVAACVVMGYGSVAIMWQVLKQIKRNDSDE